MGSTPYLHRPDSTALNTLSKLLKYILLGSANNLSHALAA